MMDLFPGEARRIGGGVISTIVAGGALFTVPGVVHAHHAANAIYFTDRTVEIEGVVARVRWSNPHVRFTIDDADGVRYEVESVPVTRLTRFGVPEDIVQVGDQVRVAGYPGRRRDTEVYGLNALLPDGRELLLDTPEPRWSADTVGSGIDSALTETGADASLGIFRVWSHAGGFGYDRGLSTYPLTDAARAALDAYDPVRHNPFLGCDPKGMPTIMQQPNPMEFVDRGDRILLLLEEYDTERVIHMNAGPDTAAEPSILGHSVGRWEGETLLIMTAGINWPYSFGQNGLPQSDGVTLTERFTVNEDGSRLDYEITSVDSHAFTQPLTLNKHWVYIPGDEVLPYECTEQ